MELKLLVDSFELNCETENSDVLETEELEMVRSSLTNWYRSHSGQYSYENYKNYDKTALNILNNHRILNNGAVLHCFSGDCFDMKAYLEAGVTHFGIGGRICYGNTELEKAVKNMPQESILLETDSPYIKLESGTIPNTSLSLFDIAAKIAEIRGTSVEHIAEITYFNALRLFDMEGR